MTPTYSRFFIILFSVFLACASAFGQITINTVAGGKVQSGILAQSAFLSSIAGITEDLSGNLVFCDAGTSTIRRILSDGTIETIAGQGFPGFGGDGGPATQALLSNPSSPAYDRGGNLYFADSANARIRRIDTHGIISTIAGTGIPPGITGFLGLGGPATQADLYGATALAITSDGNIYFNSYLKLLRVTPSGTLEALSGCDGCAIWSLAADGAGNLYVSESVHVYRVSSDGVFHQFAGFGGAPNNGNGGPAINAPASNFLQLAADSAGNVYTEEKPLNSNSSQFVIRRIGTDGIINVIAGTFDLKGIQTDGPALQSALFTGSGFGLFAGADGTVTFADDYKLRQVTSQSTIITIAGGLSMPAPNGTQATDAWLVAPTSIALDRTGQLYIGESCIIQKVDSQGLLSTVAGTGVCSTMAPAGPALTTQLNGVYSIAVDSQDQVYFADWLGSIYVVSSKNMISKVLTGSTIFPHIAIDSKDRLYFVAYTGGFARIQPQPITQPSMGAKFGLAVDDADNVYVCCSPDGFIQKYTPEFAASTLTLRGTALGSQEYGIAVDSGGNLWQGAALRGMTKGTFPFGIGCCRDGDGGPAESAYIYASALAFAPNGDLYFLDPVTSRVRRISGNPPTAKPTISAGGIVNAASLAGGAIAPGELISIFGSNFGPPGLDVAALQNNVVPKALNNVHVDFGPGTPGAITARTPNQINVFVPYNVSGSSSIQVSVDVDGVQSDPITLPVAASAFGLSTADASGSGQGAILNQDNSYNSHSNPAARGSIITLFGTGEGVTTPALPDGALVISTPYSTTQSPVTVTIGGQTAEVTYHGAAPFLPTGVFQIDVRIPDTVTPGDVPIQVSIGSISTTRTVTCAVE